MNNKTCFTKDSLMSEIMKFEFAADELTLFLDTHPCDLKALEMRSAVVTKLNKLKSLYNDNYGPITADSITDTEKWSWLDGPWPWEN